MYIFKEHTKIRRKKNLFSFAFPHFLSTQTPSTKQSSKKEKKKKKKNDEEALKQRERERERERERIAKKYGQQGYKTNPKRCRFGIIRREKNKKAL